MAEVAGCAQVESDLPDLTHLSLDELLGLDGLQFANVLDRMIGNPDTDRQDQRG
jgi:hypothetical protein